MHNLIINFHFGSKLLAARLPRTLFRTRLGGGVLDARPSDLVGIRECPQPNTAILLYAGLGSEHRSNFFPFPLSLSPPWLPLGFAPYLPALLLLSSTSPILLPFGLFSCLLFFLVLSSFSLVFPF